MCKQCQKPLASSRERNRGYCQDCPVPYDEELFESLRSWRKEQADAQSVPAFVVFSDATLEALAEVKPTDRQALQSINGIGKAKLEKYADDLLASRCTDRPTATGRFCRLQATSPPFQGTAVKSFARRISSGVACHSPDQ